ncbi:MAG: hypothetical protein ACK5LC_05165 [Coprobacillaceae bacterium]
MNKYDIAGILTTASQKAMNSSKNKDLEKIVINIIEELEED